MTSRPSPVRVVRGGDGLAIGEVSNVCIAVWRAEVSRARFDVQREGLAEVVSRHPEHVGFLCVIEPTSAPPDDELRRAIADMVRVNQPHLRCIACVVEGTGVRNAVARSTLTAMALLVGRRVVPFSVFGTVSASATWMVPHVELRDAAVLTRAVEGLRVTMKP